MHRRVFSRGLTVARLLFTIRAALVPCTGSAPGRPMQAHRIGIVHVPCFRCLHLFLLGVYGIGMVHFPCFRCLHLFLLGSIGGTASGWFTFPVSDACICSYWGYTASGFMNLMFSDALMPSSVPSIAFPKQPDFITCLFSVLLRCPQSPYRPVRLIRTPCRTEKQAT